ncbi:hypothetical protein BASA81_005750 [Batrachochytrium salamandrivorans]|nr:hypothetical protein BASA81_005750 [Batrachochytrium salamandrivorans]
MKITQAIVRSVPKSFAARAVRMDGMLQISQPRAEEMHSKYCKVLESILGRGNVLSLPKLDEDADSCFVEDTVVVLPGRHAVFIQPGHESRRTREPETMRDFLTHAGFAIHHPLTSGATLDGGDVLFTGHSFVVGLSRRTNYEGYLEFRQAVNHFCPTLQVESIQVPTTKEGLHLKSVCTMFGPKAICLAAPAASYKFVTELREKSRVGDIFQVPDACAANVLTVNHHVVIRGDEFPESKQC